MNVKDSFSRLPGNKEVPAEQTAEQSDSDGDDEEEEAQKPAAPQKKKSEA